MAYATPQDNELDQTISLDAPVKIATQAPGTVGTATPENGVVNDGSSAKPASSGTFTNLKSYLNSNQSGAQQVGGRVAGKIGEDVNAATNTQDTQANSFRDQVSQNTNTNDSALLEGVKTSPKDYLTNETLQKNLTGSYGGPAAFSGSEYQQKSLEDTQKAQQTANLANTAGGRTELINQTAAKPLTRGGANLDQWLVQGNQPSISNVLNAAATANPLKDRLANIATTQDAAAKSAVKNNQDVRQALIDNLTTGKQDYTTGLQNKATAAANDLNAQNDAIRAFLMQASAGGSPATTAANGTNGMGTMGAAVNQATSGLNIPALLNQNITVPAGAANSKDYIYNSQPQLTASDVPSGNVALPGAGTLSTTPVNEPIGVGSIPQSNTQVTPAMLKALGMDEAGFNALMTANANAKAQGLPGADLASFFRGAQSPNFDIGNVANATDIAQMNAYSKLLNEGNPVLNKGAYTPGSFDYMSAAQQIANMIAAKNNGGTGPASGDNTSTTPTIGGNTTGGYTSNAGNGGGGNSFGGTTDGGTSFNGTPSTETDANGNPMPAEGTYGGTKGYGNIVGVDGYGGFTVGEDGVATPTSTGLTNTQAGAIGTGITAITGIPGLSAIAQAINAVVNTVNKNAADGYNAPGVANGIGNNGGFTGGGAMNVGGDAPTAGEAEAAANAAATNAQAQADAQAAAQADSARAAEAAAAEGAREAAAQAQAQANAAQSAHDTGLANAKAAADSAAKAAHDQSLAAAGFSWGKEAYANEQAAKAAGEAARAAAMNAAGFDTLGGLLPGMSFTGNPAVDAASATQANNVANPQNTSAGGYTGGNGNGGPSRSGSGEGTANNAGSNSGDGQGCVDPEVPILLSTGHTKRAGDLKIGDMLYTMHEHSFKYGDFPVVAMEIIQQPKRLLKFDTGHSMLVSESHKYLMEDKSWKEVKDIVPKESIWSLASTVQIESIEDAGFGDVVKLTVDDAHTYVADGLISHNKLATGGMVRGPGTGTSDSVQEQLSNGEYVIKASVVKALGKDFLDRLNSLAK